MITLRPYQAEAVNSIYNHLSTRTDNPVCVIPTAGGKTPVMAHICRDAVNLWNGRVLVLAHVKELLEQTARHICDIDKQMWTNVGVYSAGLKSRDTDHPVIVAGVQSVYKKADVLGRFDLVMIDEAHLIPEDGEGMYRSLLSDMSVINPNVRLIGLTATPYRMKTGLIATPEGMLNHVCYEVSVRHLINQGYLSLIRSKAGEDSPSTASLHVRAGEYIAEEVIDLFDRSALVNSACEEIVQHMDREGRSSCLIFASGIKHGHHIADKLRELNAGAVEEIYGGTHPDLRQERVGRFKAREIRFLINVGVLTTGFDAPNTDCIVLLRATKSPGLYYQMVGRGFRICEGKESCLVLDYGSNIITHGPVDRIKPVERRNGQPGSAPCKECPNCHAIVLAGYSVCPECEFVFPPPESMLHDGKADSAPILSDQLQKVTRKVSKIYYSAHEKRNAPPGHPRTLRVRYRFGLLEEASEFICFEHEGYARNKAVLWTLARLLVEPPPGSILGTNDVPRDVDAALEMAKAGFFAEPVAVTMEKRGSDKYWTIVDYVWKATEDELQQFEEESSKEEEKSWEGVTL